jgi:MSHA biogenesis protein MshP
MRIAVCGLRDMHLACADADTARKPGLRRPASQPAIRRSNGGFAFVTAIFLLVVLASFAAFVVGITANAAAGGAIAVQGVRAYEAARAGLEWASFQLRDPNGTLAPGATNLPDCFASPRTLALPGEMSMFALQLTCARFPSNSATPGYHEEGNRRLVVYVVTATASAGTPGATDYVERRLEARIEKCKDPAAPGPTYAC